MARGNRFRFEGKVKGYKAGADRHRAPLPPGRCRELPVLSFPEQVQKLRQAHALTKMEAQQAEADHKDALWHANIQLEQAEEELLKETSAHQATEMQLYEAQDELHEANRTIHDKNNTIHILNQKLAAMEVERDRALANAAGLHTALEEAQHTIAQQSTMISTMQQQLAAQVSAMSRLHGELADHMSTIHPATPQLQQQQHQSLQDSRSHVGLLNTFSGRLSTSSASNTLGRNLVTAVRPSTNTPALDPPMRPEAPSVTTTTTQPTTLDSALPLEPLEVDVLSSLKATATSLLGKSKQGVMKGWSKALAFGADSGLSIGLSLSATSTPRPSCSSGGSSVEMSRWGSYKLSMSAASSRRCSSSSNSNMSGRNNSSSTVVMQSHLPQWC